jgi:hypothetical protein
MRRTGRAFLLLGAFVLLAVATLAGCENPFDPMSKSSKIEGLSYIDFSITWDRWDPDPLYDGVTVKMSYFNEFGDSLSFHDKAHNIQIEFWTQKDVNATTTGTSGTSGTTGTTPTTGTVVNTFDKLIYTKTVEFSNSADEIRIPIEAYKSSLSTAGLDLAANVEVFVIVRVFPPLESPRRELVVGYAGQTVFKPETTTVTPNQ